MNRPADRIVTCGNFSELQEKFVADVIAQRRSGPLMPLDVVVTGQLQRLYLKRELARQGCSHANVRFQTLPEAARTLATPALESEGWRLVPDTLRGLLMARAISLAGTLEYFGQIAPKKGFRLAAWNTINELRSAGLTASDLAGAAKHMPGAMRETLRGKLSDIGSIWSALDGLMTEQRWADQITLLRMACESSLPLESQSVIFYGFDELTEIERNFVERLSQNRTCAAYLPYLPRKACAWSRPVLEAFISLHYRPQMLEPAVSDKSMLERIHSGLFEAITSCAEESGNADHSVRILSVPGRLREAEEIARELLYSPLYGSEESRHIAVLARAVDTYNELLQENFTRAGIQGYFHTNRTLAQTSTGRACRMLAGLLDETYPRAEVMEFLLTSPVRWPAVFGGVPGAVPAAEWNQFTLLAGIHKGLSQWMRALQLLDQQWRDEADRTDEDDEASEQERVERLHSLKQLFSFGLFAVNRIRRIRAADTWQERVQRFWSFFCEILEHDDHFEAIRAELVNAGERDRLHDELTDESFCSFIDEVLARPISREGRFQAHEPTVSSYQQSIGLLFDEVFLPGLAEREMPRAVAQDPLLLDEEREWIQSALGGGKRIPLRSREREREAFLFYHAVHSARRRLVISYPRKDSSTSRDQLPSTYLLKVVEAATRQPTDFDTAAEFLAQSSYGKVLPLNRLRGVDPARAVSAMQFDEACLGQALDAKSLLPIAYLWQDNPLFQRGLAAERHRFHEPEFSVFDGMIRDAELRNWIEQRTKSLSPQELDGYLNCPFRYYVNILLEAVSVSDPPEVQRLNPGGRGSLVHRILKEFYQAEDRAGRLPLDSGGAERLTLFARDYFKYYERGHLTGLPALWQLDQENILNWIRNVVARDLENATRFIPRYFNEPVNYSTTEGGGIDYHGRIDRIDIDPEGRARVIDYSTSKSQSASARAANGFSLSIQRLAVEQKYRLNVDSAGLWNIADDKPTKPKEVSRADWEGRENSFYETAREIHEGMRQGKFYPYPAEAKCSRCPARAACGSGRLTLKWQDDLEQTRAFRAMAEEDPS
jgi:ATP-dependent helicase/DNAse subunit B